MHALVSSRYDIQVIDLTSSAVHRSYNTAALMGNAFAPPPPPAKTAAGGKSAPRLLHSAPATFIPSLNGFVHALADNKVLFFHGLDAQQTAARWIMPEPIAMIEASPCGAYLVGGAESGNVLVWSVSSGDLLRILRGHSRPVTSIVFSGRGDTFATSSMDGTCRVHSLTTASRGDRPIALVVSHAMSVAALAFSRFNLSWLFTGSQDATVRLHDVALSSASAPSGGGAASTTELACWKVGFPVFSVCLLMDDTTLIVGGVDGSMAAVRVYVKAGDGPCGQDTSAAHPSSQAGRRVIVHPSLSAIAAAERAKGSSWALHPAIRPLASPHRAETSVAVVNGDRFISADATGSAGCPAVVLIWDALSMQVLKEVIEVPHGVLGLTLISHSRMDLSRGVRHPLPMLKRVATFVEDSGCSVQIGGKRERAEPGYSDVLEEEKAFVVRRMRDDDAPSKRSALPLPPPPPSGVASWMEVAETLVATLEKLSSGR